RAVRLCRLRPFGEALPRRALKETDSLGAVDVPADRLWVRRPSDRLSISASARICSLGTTRSSPTGLQPAGAPLRNKGPVHRNNHGGSITKHRTVERNSWVILSTRSFGRLQPSGSTLSR